MKIYVASSWRNRRHPAVVACLRKAGHDVYDFRNPVPNVPDQGFHWSDIDPAWQKWSSEQFREALKHPIAQAGLKADYEALRGADATVLVLPCGRSAHLELGFAVGRSQATAILLSDGEEPELMYGMVDLVTADLDEVLQWLGGLCKLTDGGAQDSLVMP
jgi:hypothetical protein